MDELRARMAALAGSDIEEPPNEFPPSVEEAEPLSHIDNVRLTQRLIQKISSATLENDKLEPDVLERLRNPTTEPVDISDPDLRLSLDIFMACNHALEATYNAVRTSILRRFPNLDILSYYSVKKHVSEITGVGAVLDDMCINSCVAFVGPLDHLTQCPECSEPRYDQEKLATTRKKVPRQQACTIPLGPQLQALRRSPEGASALLYGHRKLTEISQTHCPTVPLADRVYDDVFCGSDVRALAQELGLTADDYIVSFSIDGAQLYQNKKSDTWVGIWTVYNYDPATRYANKHVLPAHIIPGPNKPKIQDSFLYRDFYHFSALQHENNGKGMAVWDALQGKIIHSRVVLLFATADALGLTELDGRVGHHGAQGCRMGCDMKGRHKPSSGHYSATHLCPNDSVTDDCNHPDYNFRSPPKILSPEMYKINLTKVVSSRDQTDYERNRKLTGISKPSILTGLNPRLMLPVPKCFTVDLMHLGFINLGELFVPLWRATLRCDPTDDKATWDWATLVGERWIEHGKLVTAATKYFPSSFHRPPRNPAEKISSGFKATEYYLYLFGLGPGFLRAVLPRKYWRHWCRVVRGFRIIMKRKATGRVLQEAYIMLASFVEEYENFYYQRRVDRLHFCRPCLHTLLHLAMECARVGPGIYTTQFTMERAIGDLSHDIRQPSNIFANLCQVALRRSQLNALKNACPELDPDSNTSLPKYAFNCGNGLIFLRPRDRSQKWLSGRELEAIEGKFDISRLRRWGRIRLPNGQIARSLFFEKGKRPNTRVSRNVKVILTLTWLLFELMSRQIHLNGETAIAEVCFYFLLEDAATNLVPYALTSMYGSPDKDMLDDSYHTLFACPYRGDAALQVIPVSSILSVVSMQPLPRLPGDPENLWFVVEKSGLDEIEPID
jgi:hypothetical protein